MIIHNDERPHTVEQIAALPEGGGFGMSEETVDGKKIRRPIASELMAFWSDEHDPMGCYDENGDLWRLGRYADGRWFRQRSY